MLERRLLWIQEFESSHPSQPVRSLLFDFRLCANCRHSRGLCKVDMQPMDWQTLVARRAKKDAANAGYGACTPNAPEP